MPVSQNNSLLVVQSNEELDRIEKENQDRLKAMEAGQNDAVVTNLAAYVRSAWESAKQAKEPHRQVMLQCLRQRNGEYDPDKLSLIQADGGSEIFVTLTDEKCNAAESWIEDILSPATGKIWSLSHTPIPEIPPEEQIKIVSKIQEKAQEATTQQIMMIKDSGQPIDIEGAKTIYQQTLKKMIDQKRNEILERAEEATKLVEKEIEDGIDESGWHDAVMHVVEDLVCFPAGILKGPLLRREMDIVWGPDGEATVEENINKYYERVSPFDIYPAPSSEDIDDGFLIERHNLTRADLNRMKGIPDSGYDDQAIDKVLEEYGRGGLKSWLWAEDAERLRIQGQDHYTQDPEAKIEALQFWGSVSGLFLLEWGMDPSEIEDVLAEYNVEAWLIGRYVIKAEINGDLLGRKPYFKASYRRRNGQFWGTSLPELIKDPQDACNAACRNLLNNAALASGPMVGVDVGAFADGEKLTKLRPWKIFQFDLKAHQTNKTPLWFFQPTPMINEMIAIYDKFSAEADNKSGIPKYAYGQGQSASGAMGTASGLSMMMGNATKAIKKVIKNIDMGIIRPSIKREHEWRILNDPEYIGRTRGDINVISEGSSSLIAKEQRQVRINEGMSVLLGSEAALGIIGVEGLAELLRKFFEGLEIGAKDIVPTKEMMEEKQKAMEQQAMMQRQIEAQDQEPEQGPGPGKSKQVQASGAKMGGSDANTVGKRM